MLQRPERAQSISERVAAGWKERSEVLRAALCQCVGPSEKETSNVDSQYVGLSSVGIWGLRYGEALFGALRSLDVQSICGVLIRMIGASVTRMDNRSVEHWESVCGALNKV